MIVNRAFPDQFLPVGRTELQHGTYKKQFILHLPPEDDSLNLHFERTNYLTFCQLHYDLLEHPLSLGYGWELVNGKCRPVRHTLPPLPQQLPTYVTLQMTVVLMMSGASVENQQILMKCSGLLV